MDQLFRLAKEMALEGDPEANRRLEGRALAIAAKELRDDWLGTSEWIELDGERAVLELARIYGQRLLADPGDFVNDGLITSEPEAQAYKEFLVQAADDDPAIKVYRDHLASKGLLAPPTPQLSGEELKAKRRQLVRAQYKLERILEDAANEIGQIPGRYATFGQYATAEELERIFHRLLSEQHEPTLVRLLWVFRRAPLPQLDPAFFDWANSQSEPLRAAAITALSRARDEKIHQLALEKVASHALVEADNEALGLFLNNYRAGDADAIIDALRSIAPNEDDAHSLGLSVLELAKKHQDPALGGALMWTYENTPCSTCRGSAIEQLDRVGQLTESLAAECRFDADERARDVANRWLKDHPAE
ncbi:MAG: hypothetical protein FIA97_03490 [Methylococcaceae bacterium]|nr:hypothetical protein [Methylococcaceae bacterium]